MTALKYIDQFSSLYSRLIVECDEGWVCAGQFQFRHVRTISGIGMRKRRRENVGAWGSTSSVGAATLGTRNPEPSGSGLKAHLLEHKYRCPCADRVRMTWMG